MGVSQWGEERAMAVYYFVLLCWEAGGMTRSDRERDRINKSFRAFVCVRLPRPQNNLTFKAVHHPISITT